MSSSDSPAFPLELLSQPDEERVQYFYKYKAQHPRLKEADKALWRAIHTKIEDTIIFCFGPPGVGKSTLRAGIERRLIREASTTLSSTDSQRRVPVLSVDAPVPERRQFDWKDFFRRSLAELEQPFVRAKTDKAPLPPLNPRLIHALAFNPRLPFCEYRLTFEHALRFRNPATFLIDDAQHIGMIASGSKLQGQMDIIKSLIRKSRTLITMIGTYELMSLRNLSGQLSRRSIDIHFSRYSTKKEDIKSFQNVLWTFQKRLPLMVEPDLVKYWEYCYVHSVGCVGILKDWLTRSLEDALSENAKTITIKILQRNALTVDQCEVIAAEALDGEERLSQRGVTSSRLMQMLGFKTGHKGQSSTVLGDKSIEKNSTTKTPRLPRAVGLRSPRRDKVNLK